MTLDRAYYTWAEGAPEPKLSPRTLGNGTKLFVLKAAQKPHRELLKGGKNALPGFSGRGLNLPCFWRFESRSRRPRGRSFSVKNVV